MLKIERVRTGILIVLLALAPAVLVAQEADTVYVNGIVHTVDEAFSKASAFAVKDGEFIYVGDDAGARSHVGPLTFVVDLAGKTVIPRKRCQVYLSLRTAISKNKPDTFIGFIPNK